MKRNKGFSLIELMIVVAIIGVLMLISIPMYRGYIIRVELAQIASMLGHYNRTFNVAVMAGDQSPSMGIYDLIPKTNLPGVDVMHRCFGPQDQYAEAVIRNTGSDFTPEAKGLMIKAMGVYYPYMSSAMFRDISSRTSSCIGGVSVGYLGISIGMDMRKMSIPGIRAGGTNVSDYTMVLNAQNVREYKIIDLYTNEVVEEHKGDFSDRTTYRPLCTVDLPSQQSILAVRAYIPKPCRLYNLSSYTYLRF